jgi:hypothetical protein
MITDMNIPMHPSFSEDARSVLEGLLERNVIIMFVNIFIAKEKVRSWKRWNK